MPGRPGQDTQYPLYRTVALASCRRQLVALAATAGAARAAPSTSSMSERRALTSHAGRHRACDDRGAALTSGMGELVTERGIATACLC